MIHLQASIDAGNLGSFVVHEDLTLREFKYDNRHRLPSLPPGLDFRLVTGGCAYTEVRILQ
jgi:hypothetical protein